MQCSGMQGIYDRLTREVHLPSIYMHCTRSYNGCSNMQGLCAQLTRGVYLPSIYILIKCNGMQGSMLN